MSKNEWIKLAKSVLKVLGVLLTVSLAFTMGFIKWFNGFVGSMINAFTRHD